MTALVRAWAVAAAWVAVFALGTPVASAAPEDPCGADGDFGIVVDEFEAGRAEDAAALAVAIAVAAESALPVCLADLYEDASLPAGLFQSDVALSAGSVDLARELATVERELHELPARYLADAQFQPAIDLLVDAHAAGGDAAAFEQGIATAIAIAQTSGTPIPQVVFDLYPASQQPVIPADQLAALGAADESVELAEELLDGSDEETRPDRYPPEETGNLWSWLGDAADEVVDFVTERGPAIAVVAALGWIGAWALRKMYMHLPFRRRIQLVLGEFSDTTGAGLAETVKAVVSSEFRFASSRSSSMYSIGGAAAELSTVQLPDQLKFIGPVLDLLRRGPRYSIAATITRTGTERHEIAVELATIKGREIVSRRFEFDVSEQDRDERIRREATFAASWLLFESLRLRRRPFVRRSVSTAPRLLGTVRWQSYAFYRAAMRSPATKTNDLRRAVRVSTDNIAASMHLGYDMVQRAVNDDGIEADRRKAMAEGGLELLDHAQSRAARFPVARARWFRIPFYADRLFTPRAGVRVLDSLRVDVLWFQTTYNYALARLYVEQRPELIPPNPPGVYRPDAALLAKAVVRALGSLALSTTHRRVRLLPFGLAVVGGVENRRSVAALMERDAYYLTSVSGSTAGDGAVSNEIRSHRAFWKLMADGSLVDAEVLTAFLSQTRLGQKRRPGTVESRLLYNLACNACRRSEVADDRDAMLDEARELLVESYYWYSREEFEDELSDLGKDPALRVLRSDTQDWTALLARIRRGLGAHEATEGRTMT